VMRPGRGRPLDLAIVRDRIEARGVRWRAEGGDVGYLRVGQFDAPTVDQLRQAIKDITATIAPDKLKGYVLDLRNSAGGTVEQAVAVADAFLDDGEGGAIKSRKPEDTQPLRAQHS